MPLIYNFLVGAGHSQPNASDPSPPLFGRLSDYSPMIGGAYNSQPAHLSVVVGPSDFNIYTTAERNFVAGKGWSTSYPGKTNVKISYNGTRKN